ncbi:MAG: hypothetical protein WA130_10850, partial [Candidatus Methanoperedens sp.]
MSESEYQDFLNKRASSIKDVGRALGIPPSQKRARELAESMTPDNCKPLRIAVVPETKKTSHKPNLCVKQTKCEMEYGRMLAMEFLGAKITPWGITLRMSNGHKYTPDFVVFYGDLILLVEVKQRGKNGFRQNSYQRAKLAYDQCQVEFPMFQYRWAEKQHGAW